MQNISKELNVSKATIVSYVLNGKGDEKGISKETQKNIINFAKEHHYKANKIARALSVRKSNLIGLEVSNISDTFFAGIARRIEIKAGESGYDVIFCSTGEKIENEKNIIRRKENNFPFVLMDRKYSGIDTNFVGLDNTGGIASAVEQLIYTGRKRIGFISVDINLETLHERLEGYMYAMDKNGLPVEENFVQKLQYERDDSVMRMALEKILQPPVSLDGLVFATQYLTAEALRELKRMKVKIPEDVALVSFGQKSDFDILEPPVAVVDLPINKVGDKAVDLLLQNMNSTKLTCNEVRFKTELIIRNIMLFTLMFFCLFAKSV